MVGGTNGKGSTVTYLCAMLRALGYRCGNYTSPHIFRYNERIQIQGIMVSDQELIDAFEAVEASRGDISLTYFEFGTLAAFRLLSLAALDFAVLEVGLGGRLDAVNILDADCAVITPIGLDHQEYLGDTLEKIAYEKAGIIRDGRPVICGEAGPPQSLLRFASQARARLQRLGREFFVEESASGYLWRKDSLSFQLPQPPMAGYHQVCNMATSVAAVSALIPGVLNTPEPLIKGLASARIGGRLQPHANRPDVWLDVGHNPHAARAVRVALRDLGIHPVDCVLGMLRDKDARAVAAELGECVRNWYCAGTTGDRGRSGAALAEEVGVLCGHGRVQAFTDVAAAMGVALEAAVPGRNILVFGSFVTVAQAAAFLSGERP